MYGISKNVLPYSAAFVKSHFYLRCLYGKFTECCKWKRIVPIIWAAYVESAIFNKGIPNAGQIKNTNINDMIFSPNALLITPYLFPTT